MPLIQCPNCKRDIISTSERCGYCGYQLKSIIIDDEDEKKTHYLLMGVRIFFVALILTGLVVIVLSIRHSTRDSVENAEKLQKRESLKPKIPNPDTLLAKAKSLYKEGKYNVADIVLTQITNNYKNSNTDIEASKLKVIVVKAIQDKWKAEQKKLEWQNQREDKKRKQELQRLYEKNPIEYYKGIYGTPDSEDDFSFESFRTKTLSWYCVGGKYRSITFELRYGTWRRQSEYTSNCL